MLKLYAPGLSVAVFDNEAPHPPAFAQGILYDGPTGATKDFWNLGLRLPWRAPLGDSKGPVVTFNVTAQTPLKWGVEVTAIFAGSFLLSSSAVAKFVSRHNATVDQRPLLRVTTAAGTYDCPCTADCQLDASTASVVSEGGAWKLDPGQSKVALQFDLSDVQGAVQDAVLILTHSAYGPATISISQLDVPPLVDGSIAGTPPADMGAVVFSHDWPQPAGLYDYGGPQDAAHGAVYVNDPLLGNALDVPFRPGVAAPCTLGHRRSAHGLPALTEGWLIYELWLSPTEWVSEQNNKMPGFAGRYGYPDPAHPEKMIPVCGNGGTGCDGKAHPAMSGYSAVPFLCGWSMRGQLFRPMADAGNPYRDLIAMCTYGYLPGMPFLGGNNGPLDSGSGQEYLWRGVALRRGIKQTIAMYFKLNSIDMSTPDALGNGIGRQDGQFKVYVNWSEVPVLDPVTKQPKTGFCFRHHPSIEGDDVWLDCYQGGTLDPVGRAHMRLGRVTLRAPVVAPPDPPAGTLPAWLQGKAIGEWVQVSNSKLADMDYTSIVAKGYSNAALSDWTYGDPRKGILAFSGGTIANNTTLMLFGGGGANAWGGNEVRALDLSANVPVWTVPILPSPSSALWPLHHTPASGYMQDGTPNSRHSYWQPQFINSKNRFMVFGCQNEWETDSVQTQQVDGYDLTAGAWAPPGTYPNMPKVRGYDASWVCKHPTTEKVYVANQEDVREFDPATNTYRLVWAGSRAPYMERGLAAVDPVANEIFVAGLWFSGNTNFYPHRVNIATGAVIEGNFVGPAAGQFAGYLQSGLVRDEGIGAFLAYQDKGVLLKLTPSGNDCTVEVLPTTGTPPPQNAYQVHNSLRGRFQYVPALKGVALTLSHDLPVYFVRTA